MATAPRKTAPAGVTTMTDLTEQVSDVEATRMASGPDGPSLAGPPTETVPADRPPLAADANLTEDGPNAGPKMVSLTSPFSKGKLSVPEGLAETLKQSGFKSA